VLLWLILCPFAICLLFNSHPAGNGPLGCFAVEAPAAPQPAWKQKLLLREQATRAKMFFGDK
jgi:hypothetical protein